MWVFNYSDYDDEEEDTDDYDDENFEDDDEFEDDLEDPYGEDEDLFEDEEPDFYGSKKKKKKKRRQSNKTPTSGALMVLAVAKEWAKAIKARADTKKYVNVKKMNSLARRLMCKRTFFVCPKCGLGSIYTEPVDSGHIFKSLKRFISGKEYDPTKETRWVCLNPGCRCFYVRTRTKFKMKETGGGELETAHFLPCDVPPFTIMY